MQSHWQFLRSLWSMTRTCGPRTRTRTCKLVFGDPQGQGLSLRTTTLIITHVSVHTFLVPVLHLASSDQWCWSGGREILTELSLCYSLVLCSISAMHNHNEQFFQVGLLDQALISLGLALSPPSTVSSDFMVLCKCFFKIILISL